MMLDLLLYVVLLTRPCANIQTVEEKELVCMAKNIYYEARNQPIEGQLAVCNVVLNRVASPEYPNSPCKVIYQKNQFSWYWDGKSDNPREQYSYVKARILAKMVLSGVIPLNTKADHYHHVSIKPYWAKGKTPIFTIGDHVFYNLN